MITFIVGLPGSGKTFLAKQMGGTIFDDFGCWYDLGHLKDVKDAIITDCRLADDKERALAIKWFGKVEIRWIFFENNPAQCIKNVKKRNDGRIISNFYINTLSRFYNIPPNSDVRSVWNG